MPATVSIRIGTPRYVEPALHAELLQWLTDHPGIVDEVAFFTGITHPPLPLATITARAARLAEVLPQYQALGLTAGINHLATMGHLDENLVNSLNEPWQHLVDLDGTVSKGCYCARDPQMAAYIAASYRVLAQAKPDFIWVDDDVRMESHAPLKMTCFCDRCLAAFSAASGRTWTREELRAAFSTGPRDERLRWRRAWQEQNRTYLTDVLALIRRAVHDVDPTINLGLMTGEAAFSGYAFDQWADALTLPGGQPARWRPGGGFYEDGAPHGLLGKAHSTGRQVGLLPPSVVDIQYEHENFPYQALRKSRRIFTTEIAAAIGCGCTGVALNCLGLTGDPVAEFLPWLTAVGRERAFYQAAVQAFGRSPASGLWVAFTPDHMAALQADGNWEHAPQWASSLHRFNDLGEIGLPFAYTRAAAKVTLLAGDGVLEFSKIELLQMLGEGVILDGPALQHLHALGLGEYTGFAVAGTMDRDTMERFTDDPLNAHPGEHRDCRPSFWPEPSYLLAPLRPASRVLSRLVDFTPTDHGAVSGVYENTLGGRVAVLGYYPWRSFMGLAKTQQWRALVRWLSADTLPGYIASYHRAALWCRQDAHGRPALLVINASIDAADGLTLHLRDVPGTLWLERAGEPGLEGVHIQDGVFPLDPADDPAGAPYRSYILPTLAPWEAVLLTAD